MEPGTGSRAASADELSRAAARLGLALDHETARLLLRLLDTLLDLNRHVNLTSITRHDEAVERHLLDSIALLRVAGIPARVIDVGTGGGLPGLALKALRPSASVTLLDSVGKKVEACREIVRRMNWSGVEVVHARAEDWARTEARQSFGLVTARAVAPLPVLMELTLPFARVGGLVVAWKGPAIDEGAAAEGGPGEAAATSELERGSRAAALLGGTVAKVDAFTLPWSGAGRRLVVVEKVRTTPAAYPRRAGVPRKSPLA